MDSNFFVITFLSERLLNKMTIWTRFPHLS
jgi:hypothetical protein